MHSTQTILNYAERFANEAGYSLTISDEVKPGIMEIDSREKTVRVHHDAGSYELTRDAQVVTFDSTVKVKA